MPRRKVHRQDANHGQVRDHLRAVGWRVFDTSSVGGGFPDLVVARRGFTALVEVKDGHRKKLGPDQMRFSVEWPGVTIKATSGNDAELQLDLAEKYQYLRRSVEHLENDQPIKIQKPKSREPSKIVRMLGGEA